jgi:hypothetical protein
MILKKSSFYFLATKWKPSIQIWHFLHLIFLTYGDWKPAKSLNFLFLFLIFLSGEISPVEKPLDRYILDIQEYTGILNFADEIFKIN